MAYVIDDLLTNLSNIGFYDFLLPWLFTFAVVYGLLLKTNIFGKNERISGIIAFVIAFFVSAYSGPALANFFTSIFAGTSVIIAGILCIILFAALIGFKHEDLKAGKYGLWAVLVIGVLLFIASAGGDFLGLRIGSSVWTMVIVVVLLIVAVAFISGGREEETTTTPAGGNKPKPG